MTLSNFSVADGEWHQVTVTVDRNNTTGGKWYVDGVLVNTFNPTGRQGSLSNSKALRLGRRSDSNSAGFFNGSLDEVKLFDSALSASEVQSIYQADKILNGGNSYNLLNSNSSSDSFLTAQDQIFDTINSFSLEEGNQIGLAGSLGFGEPALSENQIYFGSESLANLTGLDTTTLAHSNFVIPNPA
ncbi:MAG: LamG domain-containing protein [Symploca sp. SIO2G7]|nr:LamG domain-containing protein [Symploca sp. SIO2G7]